jgi:RNA polymerase sigma factor (sigma-70 family)
VVTTNKTRTFLASENGNDSKDRDQLRDYLPALVTRIAEHQDERAAELVHDFCRPRLTAFARSRIFPKLLQRVDADDVVQETFQSFFHGVYANRFQIDTTSELWNTLLAICMNKIRTESQHHTRKKRSFDREEQHEEFGSGTDATASSMVAGSAPYGTQNVLAQLRSILGDMDSRDQEVMLDSIRGMSNTDIAEKNECSERSVRRVFQRIRGRLQEELRDQS